MRTLHLATVSLATVLFGCGNDSSLGTSRLYDDASVATGGSAGMRAGTGGSRATGGASGDASADAELCRAGSVSNGKATRTQLRAPDAGTNSPSDAADASRGAEAGDPDAQSSADSGRRADAGPPHLPGLPTNPCGPVPLAACPNGSRTIFRCPIVSGPGGTDTFAPGDQISVKVPVTDEGNTSYSCMGIDSDPPLRSASVLSYAVRPAYVELSGQVPPSLAPGGRLHFTVGASGPRTGRGEACADDLTLFEFDLSVSSKK